jgi:prophage DNA circulation protein
MATNANGRVTLALLGQKVDALTSAIEGLRKDLKDLAEKHGTTSTNVAVLENRVNGWNLLNSLGVIVAAILAAFGISAK